MGSFSFLLYTLYMFFKFPKPNQKQPSWKRTVYLGLTVLLGGMVGLLVHIFLAAVNPGYPVIGWATYILLALGMIGGFFIGRVWWRWVYVEGWRFKHPSH